VTSPFDVWVATHMMHGTLSSGLVEAAPDTGPIGSTAAVTSPLQNMSAYVAVIGALVGAIAAFVGLAFAAYSVWVFRVNNKALRDEVNKAREALHTETASAVSSVYDATYALDRAGNRLLPWEIRMDALNEARQAFGVVRESPGAGWGARTGHWLRGRSRQGCPAPVAASF